MEHDRVTPEEFARLDGWADWRVVIGAIETEVRAGSFSAAAALVAAIGVEADAADHHPDLDLRYPDRVRVTLRTHDAGGLTTRDLDLARHISAMAADAGARCEPTAPQRIEIAIDTLDEGRISPFWVAVLGYRDVGGTLVDPLRIGPPLWFQQMDEPRTERNRFHLDVSVPHDVAETRIAAALAAGGTLVTAEHAPAWWVLADADGNEVCISTWQGR